MSVLRTIDATMKNFWLKIDGKPVLLDHVKQLNLYTSIGITSAPGDLTITYDMFKMISPESARFSPINKTIEFEIEDNKTGKRYYKGLITNFRKIHNVKTDLMLMTFDMEKYLKLAQVRWWKCFKEKTTLEIFKEFLEENGITLNTYPQSHEKLRSTFWEHYAIPQNVPTLTFLTGELAKDNLILFNNPDTQGITVASWYDMNRIDILNRNHPDYVVDGQLAKFDQSKDQWKEATFVNAKQINTKAPWNIMEWSSSVAPNLQQDVKHQCFYYSALKKALEFKYEESTLLPNDLNLTKAEEYSGKDLRASKLQPYPQYEALRDNLNTPHIDTTGFDGYVSNAIYPRYMYHRMRESFADGIKWISSTMWVAGSCKAVVPMSTMMVTYFPNALNRNPEEPALADDWRSGLYMIMASQVVISGNNIQCKYELSKPFL